MFQFIPYIIMAAGAAMQADEQRRAANRVNDAVKEANQRRLLMGNQASEAAAKKVQEFAPEVRKDSQDAIGQELNTQYNDATKGPALTAQGVEIGNNGPIGQNSADFIAAKAKQQARVSQSVRELASLMSRTGSAGQLRRNEAVSIGDTADQIGQIANSISRMGEIDNYGIQTAGRPNGGRMLAGQLLSTAGSAYAGYGSGSSGMTEANRTGRLPGAT